MKKKKIGIALGSGSARGWSHIGVIRSLMEAGIPIDIACGSSIGALVAGAFAADFLNTLDRWVRELSWTDLLRFIDVRLPRSGIIEGEKITGYFRQNLSDANIEDLAIPFAAVATELNTGREVWLREGSLIDAIRASVSLPGIFTPYQKGDQWLVDGGLINPVPVSLCRAMGADIVIAVNLNSDIMGKSEIRRSNINGRTLQKKVASFLNRQLPKANLRAFKVFDPSEPQRGPNLFEILTTSVYITQDFITQQRLAVSPPDILITPRLAQIGLLDFNRAEEAVEEGWRAMDLMIPRVLELLK
jgi:NTE family protein